MNILTRAPSVIRISSHNHFITIIARRAMFLRVPAQHKTKVHENAVRTRRLSAKQIAVCSTSCTYGRRERHATKLAFTIPCQCQCQRSRRAVENRAATAARFCKPAMTFHRTSSPSSSASTSTSTSRTPRERERDSHASENTRKRRELRHIRYSIHAICARSRLGVLCLLIKPRFVAMKELST